MHGQAILKISPIGGRLYLSSTMRRQVHLVRGFDHLRTLPREALVFCAPLRSVRQGLSLYTTFKEAPRLAAYLRIHFSM
jgi:hypothetical protein